MLYRHLSKFNYCPVFTLLALVWVAGAFAQSTILPQAALARKYYGNDAAWFISNTPFFECSDKQMEQVYYYRWKMYKAHIRHTGANQYVITEFINHVAWDRDPYCTINAASMHHINEGRWLKDSRFVNGYINYLYQQGGNNRSYSESIADASYSSYLVNMDKAFICRQLDSMQRMYNAWYDHYDSSKQLFYIPAMPDATEYTIASIDASGGKDGFEGGDAFRPSINSYMYGNAIAIAHVAALAGNLQVQNEYLQKAAALKTRFDSLWNVSLQHYTDRFKVSNQYVQYWNFIRGRELAGLIPWYFNLPPDDQNHNAAWQQLTDTTRLLGSYGMRTNEPSYEYYFKQFVYYQGQRGSQWNGPSWPYQTSLALSAMANLLNNYQQHTITNPQYLHVLRQYTKQHFLPTGKINLVENYDPNLGGPIVYYYWSNHYNHSSYNNLIITGLCGIRPSATDSLFINPLTDGSISYFCLDDIRYHGHRLTVMYDRDGTHYKKGKGLLVWINGKKAVLQRSGPKYWVTIPPPLLQPDTKEDLNYALNLPHKGYPQPNASVNTIPDTALYQAIDGRTWWFPEITNRWTTQGSSSKDDWYSLDFGEAHTITTIKLYPVADDVQFAAPERCWVEYDNAGEWKKADVMKASPLVPTGNAVNIFSIKPVTSSQIRIHFVHRLKQVAISEIECY